jgi:hypothetical protein
MKLDVPALKGALTMRPPMPPSIPLSDYVQQALCLLLGYSYGDTVVCHASPGGVLYTTSPRLSDIVVWTAVGDNEAHQGTDIVATELLIRAAMANTDIVYVRTRTAANTGNSYPLAKGEVINFSVENLNELRALIAKTGDKLIVGYSL